MILDVLRAQPVRTTIAELLTLCAICATLYAITVVAAGLVP